MIQMCAEGMTYAEIGMHSAKSDDAIRKRIDRAEGKISELLSKNRY